MIARGDPTVRTYHVSLAYDPECTAPAVKAWVTLTPDFALRMLVCTGCGARSATEVRDSFVRGAFVGRLLPREVRDAVLERVALLFEDTGLPPGDHTHCKRFADSGAAACRESTWAVPHAVPAAHRFEIDEFLDRMLGLGKREKYGRALLRIRRPDGDCISEQVLVPPAPSATAASTPASLAWVDVLHFRLRAMATRRGGQLEAVTLVVRLGEEVELATEPMPLALVTVVTRTTAYHSVVSALPGAIPDGERTRWAGLVDENPFADWLFANVMP